MKTDFRQLMTALEMALTDGASHADAYFERGKGLSVKVFNGGIERFVYSESMGIGVRVFREGSSGRSYTSDLTDDGIREAVRSAGESARVSPPDEHRDLPPVEDGPAGAEAGDMLGEELDIYDGRLAGVPAAEKIDLALDLERLARDTDGRVTGVETAVYGDSTGTVLLASTRGFKAGFQSSVCYGYLMAMAEEKGDKQTGFGFTAGRSFDDLDRAAAAAEAATMAVDLLGARQVETAAVPVLFDNLSTAELLAVLGSALSAESVVKGKSFLAGKEGAPVASELVNLFDDGTMPGGYGTAPFDGEGVATERTNLLDRGVLSGYMHNCYTASRMNLRSTGNADRSYRSTVGVAPTNLVLEAGAHSPEALISGIASGFEVMELQGVHAGLNPVTGELSVGARGRWIESGRRARPVREVTLAGTMEGLLMGVAGVGSDMRFTPLLGGIGAPSILVEGLVVSGK